MPRLSVWFVRACLLYLLLGFAFGALIMAQKGWSYSPPVWNLFPLHMEFLLVGWFAQPAMGVAFWILPRFSVGSPRGNVNLAWISFGLMNAGLAIGPFQLWFSSAIFIGRLFEIGAATIFAIGLWRRVKPHRVL
jgi:hypothetical protein